MPNNSNRILEMRQISAFIVFDRIIKDPDFAILRFASLQDEFREYIDVDRILTLSKESLAEELVEREEENPFVRYKIKDFNMQKNYDWIYKNIKYLYSYSPNLRMAHSIVSYLTSGLMKNVYIWNPVEDERQRFSLFKLYDKSSILEYLAGDYNEALDYAKPTLVYDWNVKRVFDTVETENWDGTYFFVSNHRFNFELNENNWPVLKYGLRDRKNVTFFPVYQNEALSIHKG